LDFSYMGFLASREGDYDKAQHLHLQAIQSVQEDDDREMSAYLSFDLAQTALVHKDLETAHRALNECLLYYGEVKNLTRIEGFFHLVIELEAEAARNHASGLHPLQQARRIAQLWGAKQRMRAELGLIL